MSKTEVFKVVVVPTNDDFRPCVLEYGISLEKAESIVKKYINDHGLTFKANNKRYPALVQIRKISDPLPDGYFLFTVKGVET